MMTLEQLARAICCPSGVCIRPEACDATNRNVVVNIPHAAAAVSRLLCDEWRRFPRPAGPMVRERDVEGTDE
jgi:hypothetical protein